MVVQWLFSGCSVVVQWVVQWIGSFLMFSRSTGDE